METCLSNCTFLFHCFKFITRIRIRIKKMSAKQQICLGKSRCTCILYDITHSIHVYLFKVGEPYLENISLRSWQYRPSAVPLQSQTSLFNKRFITHLKLPKSRLQVGDLVGLFRRVPASDTKGILDQQWSNLISWFYTFILSHVIKLMS